MMKIKRLLMTMFLGLITMVTASALTVESPVTNEQNTKRGERYLQRLHAGIVNAGNAFKRHLSFGEPQIVEEPLTETHFLPQAINADRIGTSPPVGIVRGAEVKLPQPIARISGIMLRTDKVSVEQIMRNEAYWGSG